MSYNKKTKTSKPNSSTMKGLKAKGKATLNKAKRKPTKEV